MLLGLGGIQEFRALYRSSRVQGSGLFFLWGGD